MRSRLFAILAAVAVVVLPGTGHALAPHGVADVECKQVVADGFQCFTHFDMIDPGFVSAIDTHANFHTLTPVGIGVEIVWLDGAGEKVYVAECYSTGLYVEATNTGPLDSTSLACGVTLHKDTYIAGQQTLHVIAVAEGTDPLTEFHGRLAISSTSDLA